MSATNTTIIATVVGADRPGLVELLSETIARHDGNWTESRLAHLAGQFAGMVQIEVNEASVSSLTGDLESLAGKGLSVSVVSGGEAAAASPDSQRWTLNLVGQDRSGIVSQVSRAIAGHGLNVEELDTERESAPMSGEMLFRAIITLSGPEDVDLDALRSSLEAIAHDLMVEIDLN